MNDFKRGAVRVLIRGIIAAGAPRYEVVFI